MGWDGADWRQIDPLIERGQMPNLQRLISGGVRGNLATLEPVLSPMLWNSIATGKLADAHGILGFTEPEPEKGARPFASSSRKVKALWNILTQSNLRSIVVNWWASHPAEPIDGFVVTNAFAHSPPDQKLGWKHLPGTFHPREISRELWHMRVGEHEIDDQSILPFIPRASEIDQETDRRLGIFAGQLAQCASIQAAATHLMATQEWDFSAVYFEGIDHFCHGFVEYQEPKMPHIRQEDFEIYKDVVSGAYRFHDMMLGAMLQLIDEDTCVIVCSDHGFHSGNTRPAFTPNEPAGPAFWHRPLGVLTMSGPGIKKGDTVYGAGLLDITPTILTYFGLPVGADMQGRVLADAFDSPPTLEKVASWESVDGFAGMHPDGFQMDSETSSSLLDQFAALGYIEAPGDNARETAEKTALENDYNLAKVYLGSGRPESALPILLRLVEGAPWEHRFLVHLARCYYETGYLTQALNLLEAAFPTKEVMPPSSLAMAGRIHVRLGDLEKGTALLEQATARDPKLPGLHVEIARTYQRQRNWEKVIECAERELANNTACAPAQQIKAAAEFRMEDYEAAVESALEAIAVQYWFPQAHFILGVSLLKLDDHLKAAHALAVAVQMQPDLLVAHRFLAQIYRSKIGDLEKSTFHKMQASVWRTKARQLQQSVDERALVTFPLPDIPSPQERLAMLQKERPREKMGTKFRTPKPSGKVFTIVSGLPRSGTSLMMQMLDAGGISAQTDRERSADDDNPQGYFEWEPVKSLHRNPEIFNTEGLENRVVKVVSMLLNALPQQHQYRILFMNRPSEQVARSQRIMIDRLGTEGIAAEESEIISKLDQHRDQVLKWIESQPNMACEVIDYPSLVANPNAEIERIVGFVGAQHLPNSSAMAGAVRPELHRRRGD